MAWETRHGRRFFYRKVRIGHQVRSIYVGSEEAAGEIIRKEVERRQREEERRADFQRRKTTILTTFATVEAACRQIELVMWAWLLSEGFHFTANAEWRFRYAKRKTQ